MYVQHYIVAHLHGHCSHGNETIRFHFIVAGIDVKVKQSNYSPEQAHSVPGD